MVAISPATGICELMLPTFVIGLREGVEASLIIGIIAAFLGTQGRTSALRWVWIGVGLAVAMCVAIGLALGDFEGALSQRQQEQLETVVALVAVGMVSYMIVWMRRHARGLKGDIESHLASALAKGSIKALVVMAFLAVFREGLETVIFLLAVFQQSEGCGGVCFGVAGGSAVLGAAFFGASVTTSGAICWTGFGRLSKNTTPPTAPTRPGGSTPCKVR